MANVKFDNDDEWKAGTSGTRSKSRSLKNNTVHSKFKVNLKSNKQNLSSNESKHVVIKITGGASNVSRMKDHFHYISRNDQLELIDDDGIVHKLKDLIDEVTDDFNADMARKDSKKSYQIMFSTHGKNDSELLRKIVSETMKEQFPNANFYTVIHQDTANTHAHVVLMRRSKDKKERIEIRKSKLNSLKKTYSKKLNENGIKSYFLSETDKQKAGLRQKSKIYGLDKRKGNDEYTVIDHGKAKYKFDEDGKDSYYLLLKTRNGTIKEHWSLGLQDEIFEKEIKIGDNIKLKKTNTKEFNEFKNHFVRSTWNIDKVEKLGVGHGNTEFKIIDFGKAKYKFDEQGKDSYYLIMKNKYGEQQELWAKSLEEYIKHKGLKTGDMMNFDGEKLNKVQEKQQIKVNNSISL